MKVITFLNEKGGVGKTTLAIHMAAFLAAKGSTVVLADTDPQGTATTAFGLQEWPGLYNLIVRGKSWKDTVLPVDQSVFAREGQKPGALLVLGSNIETRAIPQLIDDTSIFPRRLAEVRDYVDWVIIDTPPTPSMLHGSAYLATDFVVYPTKLETWSVKAVVDTKNRLGSANERRQKGYNLPPIHSLGIVPTQTRLRTIDHQENLLALKQTFGEEVFGYVNLDEDGRVTDAGDTLALRTAWAEATSMNLPIWSMDPNGQATSEMDYVFTRLLAGVTA